MTTVTYQLPWPPSLNAAYRAVDGRVLLSAQGRGYLKKVINALPKGAVEPLKGRLHVEYYLCPPDTLANRLWDIANREKVLSDALTKARVWVDDSQIDRLLLVRGRDQISIGGALVTITEQI